MMMAVVEVEDASNINEPIGKESVMNSIKNTTAAQGQKAVYRKGEERNVVCWAIVEKLETASGDVERVDRIVGMVINEDKVVPAPTIEGFVKYTENGSSTSGEEVETRDLLFGNE